MNFIPKIQSNLFNLAFKDAKEKHSLTRRKAVLLYLHFKFLFLKSKSGQKSESWISELRFIFYLKKIIAFIIILRSELSFFTISNSNAIFLNGLKLRLLKISPNHQNLHLCIKIFLANYTFILQTPLCQINQNLYLHQNQNPNL